MPTLLIVEDDPEQRHMLRMELEHEGFTVAEAKNARCALEILDAQRFDVVVCDMKMEETDSGIKLAKAMLSPYRPGLDTIFIIYTLWPTYEHCVTAIKAGAYDYISKLEDNPIDLLVKACRKGLDEAAEWASDPDVDFVRNHWSDLVNEYGEAWIAVRAQEVIANAKSLGQLYEEIRHGFPRANPYIVHLELESAFRS